MAIDSEGDIASRPRYRLPAAAFTSAAWFEREMEQLFAHAWLLAGLDSDIPEPGDYLTLQAGLIPLLVVRQRDSSLRAFHNICRHRGAVMLEGNGNVKSGISCFYHRWQYDLDGSLRGVPQAKQFPEMADGGKRAFGLLAASVDVWNGMIFVNADSEPAENLSTWLGDVPKHFGPWQPSELLEVGSATFEIDANWKLFIENHIDCYHLWHLHNVTLGAFDHGRQSWMPCGRNWLFYEPDLKVEVNPESQPTPAIPSVAIRLPTIPGVGPELFGSSVGMLFPNVGTAGAPTFFTFFRVDPLSASKSRVIFRNFVKRPTPEDLAEDPGLVARIEDSAGKWLGQEVDADGAASPLLERLRRATDRMDPVAEDKLAVESVQRGLSSGRFRAGPLARDHEAPIELFHQSIEDFLPLSAEES